MVDALSDGDLAALSIFPLPGSALFPGALLPLHVFERRYRELVSAALSGSKVLAVARLRPGFETEYEGRPPVFEVCGAGRIVEHVEHDDGRYHILLRGISRVRIVRELPALTSYRVVRAELIADLPADRALCSAYELTIQALWRSIAPKLPERLRDLADVTQGADGPGAYSDRLAAVLVGEADMTQALLAEPDPCERLRVLAERLQAFADSVGTSSRTEKSKLN
jgi:Lon protease-like protein